MTAVACEALGCSGQGKSPNAHSLTVSSSHGQCTVTVVKLFIIVELARKRRWSKILEPIFCPGRDFKAEPYRLALQHPNHQTTAKPWGIGVRNPGNGIINYCGNINILCCSICSVLVMLHVNMDQCTFIFSLGPTQSVRFLPNVALVYMNSDADRHSASFV